MAAIAHTGAGRSAPADMPGLGAAVRPTTRPPCGCPELSRRAGRGQVTGPELDELARQSADYALLANTVRLWQLPSENPGVGPDCADVTDAARHPRARDP